MSILSCPIRNRNPIVFIQSSAMSESATTVRNQSLELQIEYAKTITFGEHLAKILESLWVTQGEHSVDNWDGYGAKAINYESYNNAFSFALSLPSNLPVPEIYVEPDGEVVFEWYEDKRKVFSISIGPRNRLAYAGLYGSNKTYGVEYLYDDVPEVILNSIYRLY